MCGICGYMHLDSSKRPSEEILKGMTAALVHRGPDDEGFYLKDNIGLGHRRLSIIDLDTGRQPIFNEDSTIAIVYNGEVYNFPELKEILSKKGHAFRTRSDTEVVLHAYEEYGEDCVKLFNGMFAFAIWDSRNRKLFLGRDRFGKKPLYYCVFDNQFIFASELKSILRHPSVRKEIDLKSLGKYLSYDYIPSPGSIFRNIYKLEAGSKMSVGASGYRTTAYWDLRFDRPKMKDRREVEEILTLLLKEAVRRRLVSDVPLGVFLSGGIDSSSVVAMMAELMDPKEIKTFSIGFKESSYDESASARVVAGHFGTDHHEEFLGPDSMLAILPKVLDVLDEPFADASIIPTYLVSAFTRRSVKVALGGDGGDELFLGYPSFLAHRIESYMKMVPRPFKKLPLSVLSALTPTSQVYMGINYKARQFLRGLDFPEEVRHQAWIGSFLPKEQKALFLPSHGHAASDTYERTGTFFARAGDVDTLDRASYIYVNTYMSDDILAKVDRASMANSLEARAPFLDMELAEFAATIPSSFKLRNFKTKWILKRIVGRKLPPETLTKRKQGFAVPVAKWLKDDLKGLLLDAFAKAKIEREGIFDHAYIKEMTERYFQDRDDLRKEIWGLFLFEMWYDRWMK
jgi:asparagine synthase (glutamine-hydrolysing)